MWEKTSGTTLTGPLRLHLDSVHSHFGLAFPIVQLIKTLRCELDVDVEVTVSI